MQAGACAESQTVRPDRRKTFETLNAMRGVAAIGVVFYHGDNLLGVQFAPRGYLAVDLFFVLSGFVIAHAYDAKLAGSLDPLGFMKMRLLRFYPLYMAGIAAGVLFDLALLLTGNSYALGAGTLMAATLAASFYIPFPVRGDQMFPLNVPAWSLFFELVVNLLYALFFRWLTSRVLFIILGVTGPILIAAIFHHDTADLGAQLSHAYVALPRAIFSFAAGILLYRHRVSLPGVPPIALLGITIACLVVPAELGVLYDMLFIGVVSPLLVAAGAAVEPSQRLQAPFSWLGAISFPLYAVHRPILSLAEGVREALGLPPLLFGLAVIALTVIFAWLLDRLYDRPLSRMLKRPPTRVATA